MPAILFFCEPSNGSSRVLDNSHAKPVVPIGFSGKRGGMRSDRSVLRWHSAESAPIDLYSPEEGTYAFLIGEAIADEPRSAILTAQTLYDLISTGADGKGAEALSSYSGFYAWIVVLQDGSIHAGVDPFGLFPLYYFEHGGSFGMATSLKGLHQHPAYDSRIDPVGFSRYLIENGCSGWQTLEKGGRRLDIAESLSYHPKLKQVKRYQHRHPGKDVAKQKMSPDEAVELSVHLSKRAVERHVHTAPDSMLLSGGLDSRHVLTHAFNQGMRPPCMTIGALHGYECLAASRVARVLKLPWMCSGGFFEHPENAVRNELELFSLGGGFNGTGLWTPERSMSRGNCCLNGLYLDVLYSPFWKPKPNAPEGSFEYIYESWISRFGMDYAMLRRLYRHAEFINSVDGAVEMMRSEHAKMSGCSFEESWQTFVRYRGRAHLGAFTWKTAFFSWPMMPGIDVPLAEGLRTLEAKYFDKRWIQKQTLIRLHPQLAEIPLAGRTGFDGPMIENRRSRRIEQRWSWQQKWYPKLGFQWQRDPVPGDTRSQVWVEAVKLAEARPQSAQSIFDMEGVAAFLDQVNLVDRGATKGKEKRPPRRALLGGLCWLATLE